MAGMKGRSGGARAGAGRKRKAPVASSHVDPLEFLRAVWSGELDANAQQVRAAILTLPYVHRKMGEGGKKDAQQASAARVASRFAPVSPPRLVVSNDPTDARRPAP